MANSRPTMGDKPLNSIMCKGGHADRSRYTISEPKKTMGRGASPTGTAGKKGRSMIHEANGPACHVSATLYKRNAAEASATERNVRILPSAIGNRDFWDKRH